VILKKPLNINLLRFHKEISLAFFTPDLQKIASVAYKGYNQLIKWFKKVRTVKEGHP